MLGIGFWDWAAILVYLFGITAIGVWTVTRIKDSADFFMGGRMHNKWFMMFFAFGSGTSGNDAVGVSAKTYTSGMSGIWYQWLWLFATPFYWLIAPAMRRMRCITTGDYFEQRYDSSVAGLYSLVGVLQLTFNIGILLLGCGTMIDAVTQGAIDKNFAIVGMTVMFVLYGVAGGLTAAIITDFIQGILTVVLSFMLLPVALKHVGGMSGLREAIGDPHMFTIVSPGEINLFHIIMSCTLALAGIATQPHIMGVCAAGKTEFEGRFGFASGNLLKRFCTIPWMLVGLCGVAMYPGLTGSETDQIYGRVARDLLPGVMPGLVGIFLAALLASVMSSCDAFMVSCSGLFTQNFYRRFIGKNRTEGHYVFVGRIVSVFIVVIGLMFAYTVSNVPRGLELFFQFQALMAAAFWLGLFWRRTTVAGAWAGTLVCLGVWAVTSLPPLQGWYAQNLPEFMIWNDRLRYSYSSFFYLSAGFATAVVVSLFTKRVAQEKLDRLYTCLRTPIQENEPHQAPFTVPAGSSPTVRKLVAHPDFEIYVPSAQSLAGFGVFWAFVVGLIGFVYWLTGLGQ
ncbi:MAG: solute:sodium symporter family transporter [Candidatus Hydrogenedentota bacterium]